VTTRQGYAYAHTCPHFGDHEDGIPEMPVGADLDQIYANALPIGTPGAWIRDAIETHRAMGF